MNWLLKIGLYLFYCFVIHSFASARYVSAAHTQSPSAIVCVCIDSKLIYVYSQERYHKSNQKVSIRCPHQRPQMYRLAGSQINCKLRRRYSLHPLHRQISLRLQQCHRAVSHPQLLIVFKPVDHLLTLAELYLQTMQ